ncbi:hypothetical protein EVAR_103366_1 [Eumeta japonica]|uniref:Uncharacterized protein n=1 Tax=Eumeta variegata TaxID=151549 RepID=A0A4C1Y5I2_EUMVA|nr:hypothetical protein EVAR_103366_1 [Eumeta japonica]
MEVVYKGPAKSRCACACAVSKGKSCASPPLPTWSLSRGPETWVRVTVQRNSAAVKLVTQVSQWRKIGRRGRKKKGRRALNLCIALFADYSERQSFSGNRSCNEYTNHVPAQAQRAVAVPEQGSGRDGRTRRCLYVHALSTHPELLMSLSHAAQSRVIGLTGRGAGGERGDARASAVAKRVKPRTQLAQHNAPLQLEYNYFFNHVLVHEFMTIYYALAGWSGNRERRDERTKRKKGKEKGPRDSDVAPSTPALRGRSSIIDTLRSSPTPGDDRNRRPATARRLSPAARNLRGRRLRSGAEAAEMSRTKGPRGLTRVTSSEVAYCPHFMTRPPYCLAPRRRVGGAARVPGMHAEMRASLIATATHNTLNRYRHGVKITSRRDLAPRPATHGGSSCGDRFEDVVVVTSGGLERVHPTHSFESITGSTTNMTFTESQGRLEQFLAKAAVSHETLLLLRLPEGDGMFYEIRTPHRTGQKSRQINEAFSVPRKHILVHRRTLRSNDLRTRNGDCRPKVFDSCDNEDSSEMTRRAAATGEKVAFARLTRPLHRVRPTPAEQQHSKMTAI